MSGRLSAISGGPSSPVELSPTRRQLSSSNSFLSNASLNRMMSPSPSSSQRRISPTNSSRRGYHSSSSSYLPLRATDNHKRDYGYFSRSNSDPNLTAIQIQAQKTLNILSRFGPQLQLLLLLVVTILVLQSHYQSGIANEQLRLFQQEESLLLLQLHKIEHSSLQLHENVRRRLQKVDPEAVLEEHDGDALESQTSELYQMNQELSSEILPLKEGIQHEAIDHIVEEFGEGPVKVVLELEFPNNMENKAHYITIMLWPDTPHAAWTFLEQVGRHVFDGASFSWNKHLPTLEVTPSKTDPLQRGQLDFVEHLPDHPHWHKAWTVGVQELRHTDSSDEEEEEATAAPGEEKLQLFFNLKDNTASREACIGRVVDGFGSLQRLLEASLSTDEGEETARVRIRRSYASHMTRQEMSLI